MPVNSRAAKAIADSVATDLKALGYRRRGRVFNRQMDDGLVHVAQLNLQLASSAGAGSGSFMFGVLVPRMDGEAGRIGFVPEFRCHLRNSQENPHGTTWPEDFVLGTPRAAEVIARSVHEVGLPWLERFRDEESVLRAWEAEGDTIFGLGTGSWPYKVLRLYAIRGDTERVAQLAFDYAAIVHPPHFHERLVEALDIAGLGHLVPELPAAVSEEDWRRWRLDDDL